MAASSRPDSESKPSIIASVDSPDVVVIGAGVCGLGIAWRLRRRGLSVTVLDRGPVGAGASRVAGADHHDIGAVDGRNDGGLGFGIRT